MKQDERYIWLDLVRGLSAILVCAGHLRAVALVDYAELTAPTLFQKLLYGLTGLGHEAVMVFFVLSGMFVGGSVLKAGDRFSWAAYGTTRLTRLWGVLLPALVLTYLIDSYTLSAHPEVAQGEYAPLWTSGPRTDGSYSTSLVTFLGNLGFVQTIGVPTFGTNSPLWSLANEFWYYVLFPLGTLLLGISGKPAGLGRRLLAGGAIAALAYGLPRGIWLGYLIWLLGVLVYRIQPRFSTRRRWIALLVTLGLFGASLGYSKSLRLQEGLGVSSDLVVGLAFATLCLVLAKWPRPRIPILGPALEKIAIAAADLSYSLYTIHFPVVLLIATHFYLPQKCFPDLPAVLQYLGFLSLLLGIGAAFWYLCERHTPRIRRALIGKRLSVSGRAVGPTS
ncbi:acyltransferase [Telmatocola sphagniphila]|uniref:Acyltransferase n=1 Tax=Telmatocola sphagniphila TaxID=1123043 RepID=A0A8E6B9A3_9BACT|nr:acyltransferase [Telmatocola sphagniphila]QVL33764.1 acyltransferase [Telmatocola sphagniphila]